MSIEIHNGAGDLVVGIDRADTPGCYWLQVFGDDPKIAFVSTHEARQLRAFLAEAEDFKGVPASQRVRGVQFTDLCKQAEGNVRCECGCKYWEYDRCIDCGFALTPEYIEQQRVKEAV